MNNEQEWIDWHPKVGDVRPQVYRFYYMGQWNTGKSPGAPISDFDLTLPFQLPASKPAPKPTEARPPWIDPQCKFRWGDRVKCFEKVLYVINPNDTGLGRVIAAPSLWEVPPYSTKSGLVDSGLWHTTGVDGYTECTLTPYPENLPQHFDDRLLDADGPQALRKAYGPIPRDIWVNEYPTCFGQAFTSYDTAKEVSGEGSIRIVHFREVL